MSTSKKTLKLMKSLYWIVGIFMHLWLCYILFVGNRAITGVVWLILGLLLLFVMYMYYFPPGDPGSSWPPYITYCPDYMTRVSDSVCMDFVGLNSQIQKADPANPPQPTESQYNRYVFDPRGSVSQKIAHARAKGLTWEGLF